MERSVPRVSAASLQEGIAEVVERHAALVITGVAEDWPALDLWTTGPERLVSLHGPQVVDVSVSESSIFQGDVGNHAITQLPFCEVVNQAFRATEDSTDHHLYLAQIPVALSDGQVGEVLPSLRKDYTTPQLLTGQHLTSVNLWLSTGATRSNLHYDCHENLLVVIGGTKRVTIHDPSCTPSIAPTCIFAGASTNHSTLPPNAVPPCCATPLTAVLEAGDGLYIPEGFWHQVDSEKCTIALNFWWNGFNSRFASKGSKHMAPYYFRRIADSLLSAEKERLIESATAAPSNDGPLSAMCHVARGLALPGVDSSKTQEDVLQLANFVSKGSMVDFQCLLPCLDFPTLRALLTRLLEAHPSSLQFLLSNISPVAAEVMTTTMEAADASGLYASTQSFYEAVFSVVPGIVPALMRKKQVFAKVALERVFASTLGYPSDD